MMYFERGSKTDIITAEDTRAILKQVFDAMGPKKRVLALCSLRRPSHGPLDLHAENAPEGAFLLHEVKQSQRLYRGFRRWKGCGWFSEATSFSSLRYKGNVKV